MNDIKVRKRQMCDVEELSRTGSWICRLHPLTKLIITCLYIVITASFSKYNLNGQLMMVIYPVLLFVVCRIPLKNFLYRVRFVLPMVLAVGIFNPIFDKSIVCYFECGGSTYAISGGMISMLTLMLKGLSCLMAAFLLIATTSIEQICLALRKIKVPQVLVIMIMLTYRYIHVLMNELAVMSEGYLLRAPGQKGITFNSWGSFLGNLLLRSIDRAEQIYYSMELRGFDGDFHYADCDEMRAVDYLVIVGAVVVVLLCRTVK